MEAGTSHAAGSKDTPELAEALRKHQYGGIILFGANIQDTEQVAKLLSDLQINNAENENA